MTLAPGDRLGPYQIVAPLGAGGMGEVFRARDTRLGREVAVKVLPEGAAADPERRARFEQEARSASALNHPNIVTLLDIGDASGLSYIAMEYVEGRTLRELLAGGPLPARKTLDLAGQLADGLAKAHGAGIVHRDLKPENVMVSKDGFVKILDFGLAKLTAPLSDAQSQLQTAAAPDTGAGAVLGTVGYMSPEQASGGDVDFRTDQSAVGTILYEMVTGKRPFQRPTAAETLTAIIREDPEDVAQLNPRAPCPPALDRRPLPREGSRRPLRVHHRPRPRHREPARAPVGVDLRGGGAHARSRAPALAAAGRLARARARRGGRDGGARPARGGEPGARAALPAAHVSARHRLDRPLRAGRPVGHLRRRLGRGAARGVLGALRRAGVAIAGLPPADVLSISRTGEVALSLGRHYVYGWETRGTLARVPLGGGAPRKVLEDVEAADWSPDGEQLAVARDAGATRRLEFPIGKVLYETAGWVSDVRVSPDGQRVAFWSHPSRGDNLGSVEVVEKNGPRRSLGPGSSSAGLAWAPDGRSLWTGGFQLSLEGQRRRAIPFFGGAYLQDVAAGGRALFDRRSFRREIVGRAPGRTAEANLSWLDWSYPQGLSGDGRTVLFDEQNAGRDPNYLIYLRGTDGSPAVRLGEGQSLALSPDGKWALARIATGQADDLVLLPTGAGGPRTLPRTGLHVDAALFFPDGRRLLLGANEAGHASRLFVLNLEQGGPKPISPEGVSFLLGWDALAPDGRMAVARAADGTLGLYPTDGGEPRPVPGVTPDDVPIRFTANGKGLYLQRGSGAPAHVDVLDVATGRRRPWKELTPPDPAGILAIGPIFLSDDGQSYVYSYRRLIDDLYLVEGLR
jgi:dipeptidyl aminopeptidase/acylaminoacyl peptidase/predicted Ser/Thr protein kinase